MNKDSKTALLDYKAPGSFEETRYEKLHNVIVNSSTEGSLEIAHTIANLIRKNKIKRKCVF
jgi:glucosamine-6-phosphate deaminase